MNTSVKTTNNKILNGQLKAYSNHKVPDTLWAIHTEQNIDFAILIILTEDHTIAFLLMKN